VTNNLRSADRRSAEQRSANLGSANKRSAHQDNLSAELVRLAQQGNEGAFAALFQAYKSPVYSLCLRMTSDKAQAENLTKEAFLQVFRRLAVFQGELVFSTWLYRVAAATVVMHSRRTGTTVRSIERLAASGSLQANLELISQGNPAASEMPESASVSA